MVAAKEKLIIRDIRARAVFVPLGRPVATKVGEFAEWPLILLDLYTEEGITGQGYLAPYIKQSAAYIIPALHDIAKIMKGEQVAPVQTYRKARASLGLVGYQGVSTIAVAGFDMACWDVLAKAAGVPLATLLGGTIGPVKAYNSNGLGLMPADKVADEALELLAEGDFKGLKVRVGRETLAEDLAAVRNVRKAVGDDVILVCDFNQGLNLGEAMRRCRALDAENVYWIEEPIAYDDLEGNAKLARETATPIQIGENFYGPRAMYQAIAAGACDYVMPDLMRIGGVTGWLRAAAIADAVGMDMSSHLYPEISSHLMRVTPTAHWLEWQDWAHPILAEPFKVVEGHIRIRDVPGNGLEWDEDAISRYRFDV
ncbi:MAG TPA: enolase C-terminal domain-like protein [Pyrinomonadaceae bacterium]|nr:enolase C-terminal domain-like protein [Pyrinomonadaceae bacterium]